MTPCSDPKLAQQKTRPTDVNVATYLDGITPQRRRTDGLVLLDLIRGITGLDPVMWGPSIIGFGTYHYRYESGREGNSFLIGFAPRKQNLVVYIMPGFGPFSDLLSRLGKHRTGGCCLYINKLDDVSIDVLEDIVRRSVDWMQSKYAAPEGKSR